MILPIQHAVRRHMAEAVGRLYDIPTDDPVLAAIGGLIAEIDANETKIDTIDSVVDAIKLKTDNLPADPADQSAVEAAIAAATSPLATASALATVGGYIDTEVGAIKTKTDQLTFTVANQVDTNTKSIAGTAVTGDGSIGNEWGPA